MKKFISTERSGFKMTFANGLTVSVQWGPCNYCDNKALTLEDVERTDYSYSTDAESNTAEIAIMLGNTIIRPHIILTNSRYSSHYITLGYLSPDEILSIINNVKEYPLDAVNSIREHLSYHSVYPLY